MKLCFQTAIQTLWTLIVLVLAVATFGYSLRCFLVAYDLVMAVTTFSTLASAGHVLLGLICGAGALGALWVAQETL